MLMPTVNYRHNDAARELALEICTRLTEAAVRRQSKQTLLDQAKELGLNAEAIAVCTKDEVADMVLARAHLVKDETSEDWDAATSDPAYKLALFADNVRRSMESAQEVLNSFQKRFVEDPYYAFEWGDEAMRAAARLHVGKKVLRQIEANPKVTVEGIKRGLTADVMLSATYAGSRSTSRSANSVEAFALAVTADLVRGHWY